MKYLITLVALNIITITSFAQGIKFTNAPNWSAVLTDAKNNNKFIFVDVYATWCKPCKLMDSLIFPNANVGKLMNDRFISIKLQTDQTASDSRQIQQWYNDAKQLNQRYKFAALPTQIILSPQGELLYQATGYAGVDKFIGMVKFATDPKTLNFRKQLEQYKNGEFKYPELPGLISLVANVFKDEELTSKIYRDYTEHYLNKQSDSLIYTKENFNLISGNPNLVKSSDKLFQLFRKRGYAQTDSILQIGIGSSSRFISAVITKEELEAKLWKNDQPLNKNPDWLKLEKTIKQKYPELDAKNIVYQYQLGDGLGRGGFYQRTANHKMMNMIVSREVDNYLRKGDDNSLLMINNICWFNYFFYATDSQSLESALEWCTKMLKKLDGYDPDLYDTKAALLYKLGRRKEAIAVEEEIIAYIRNNNIKKGRKEDAGTAGFQKIVNQMKNGEKLYPDEVTYPKGWKLKD